MDRMDPIILDFAVGILIGATSELFFLKRSDQRKQLKRTTVRAPAKRPSPIGRPSSPIAAARSGRSTIATPQVKSERQPDQLFKDDLNIVAVSRPILSSCPTCGLKAPEKLMAEHLLGSPLHRRQRPIAPTPIPVKKTVERSSASFE